VTDARDLLIVGAGPAGLATAIAARKAGVDYEVVEKGALVNSIFHFPRNQVFFTTPELLEIGELPFVTPYEKPTRPEALRYYRRVVEAFALRVTLGEEVVRLARRDGGFEVLTRPSRAGSHAALVPASSRGEGDATRTRRARHVVIACGYYDNPNLLGVPGEGLPHVSHYYVEAHAYHGRRVVVVGGKNSAALAALDLHRNGARVTLVHRRSGLGDSIKYWIRPDIENRIQEGSIAARLLSRVVEIRASSIVVEGGAGREEIAADAVFLLTGYHPDRNFLEGAGVQVDPATGVPAHDPETLETNVAGLFVAGSMVSGNMTNRIFIENGRFHGEMIVKKVLADQLSGPSGSPKR
jgi:thioredoxin reductase (NADPH)